MKDFNITVNYGFYLGKTKKNIVKTTLNLIKSNKVCFGIDSANNLYTAKNNKIISKSLQVVQNEKYFFGTFTIPEEINSIFKYKYTEFSIRLSFQEKEMWIDYNKYITLYLYPLKILVEDYWLNVTPRIKVFDNNYIIISYDLSLNKNIANKIFNYDFIDAKKLYFDEIMIPKCYFDEDKKEKHKIYKSSVMGENIDYYKIDFAHNFFTICDLLRDSFNPLINTDIYYARTFYYVHKNCSNMAVISLIMNEVDNKTTFNYNFSLPNKPKHYFNPASTIVISNDNEYISASQSIEEKIILLTLNEFVTYRKILDNKYKYKKLIKKYNSIIDFNINPIYSNYVEVNEIIEKLNVATRGINRMHSLQSVLEQKIKEKETYYQEKTTLFVMLLSFSPVADYIIYPMLKYLLLNTSLKSLIPYVEKYLPCLPLTQGCLSFICYILSIGLIYVLYKIIKNKM